MRLALGLGIGGDIDSVRISVELLKRAIEVIAAMYPLAADVSAKIIVAAQTLAEVQKQTLYFTV